MSYCCFVVVWYGHAAYSYPAELSIEANCNWSSTVSAACHNAVDAAESLVGSYYIYDIYDTCPHDLNTNKRRPIKDIDMITNNLDHTDNNNNGDILMFSPWFRDNTILRDLGFVCVLESVSSDYLNRADVQQAIHVTIANVSTWGPCGNGMHDALYQSSIVKNHRLEMAEKGLMAPNDALGDLYKKILLTLPILIYSGDVDQCVPYYYSDNWLRVLGYPVLQLGKPGLMDRPLTHM